MRFMVRVDLACSGQMKMRTVMVRMMMASPHDQVLETPSIRLW